MTPATIKKIRCRLGLNKGEFADCLQVRPAAITRYENGQRYPVESVLSRLKELAEFVSQLDIPHFLPCQLYKDHRGALRVWGELPFAAVRYFLIDMPKKTLRGEHAHQHCDQIISSLKGEFHLRVTPQNGKSIEHRVFEGAAFYVPRMHWIELITTSRHSADILVLCSEKYNPQETITDISKFLIKVGDET